MEFSLNHIGINPGCDEQVEKLKNLCLLLGLRQTKELPTAWFIADGRIELLKEKGAGTNGHLAFYTDDIPGAVALLEEHGMSVDPSTNKYNPDGSVRLVYLKDEICGFAVHLTDRK